MNLRPPIIAFMIAFMLAAVMLALAHDVVKGPNGGRVVEAGAYHVELVATQHDVEVYVTDTDDKPVPSVGFKGTAILVVDGKPQRIALQPDGNTRLSGKAVVVLPKEPKGVVQLVTPNGKTAQAQFK
jgi:hypothetical protein